MESTIKLLRHHAASDAAAKLRPNLHSPERRRRRLHSGYNVKRLRAVYEKYGDARVFTEGRAEECIPLLGSRTAGVSSDDMIQEFGLETMRDYTVRARRDRQAAIEGTYRPSAP